MTCPSELNRSRYADGALPADEAAALEHHLDDCAECRSAIANIRAENLALKAAARTAVAHARVPPFPGYPTPARLLLGVVGLVLATGTVQLAWTSLGAATMLPGWLGWLGPDATDIGMNLILAAITYLIAGSGNLMAALVQFAKWTALSGAGVLGVWLFARRGTGSARSLVLSFCAVILLTTMAAPGHAFELRRDDTRVTIPAGETIDDSLLVAAETVVVEGTVTGDLIAIGEQVTVRGQVGGNLLAAAEVLNVEGSVSGSVLSVGETVDIRGASLGANLYGAGSRVTVDPETGITGNATLAGKEVELQGDVGRDLVTVAQSLSLSGNVEGGFRAYGEALNLDAPARVGGDLTVRLKSADDLKVAAGAEVVGDTALSFWPEPRNRYLTFEYYLGVALKLLAAFVAGLVLFNLVPALRQRTLTGRGEALTAAGIGAVVLVATPVLAGAATLTLIGAPIGISAFMLWLIALYAAGIVTAGTVGRLVLDDSEHGTALPLIVGLVIVFVLINVPLVGGLVRLVVVVLGLGLIVQWLRQLWAARAA